MKGYELAALLKSFRDMSQKEQDMVVWALNHGGEAADRMVQAAMPGRIHDFLTAAARFGVTTPG